MKTHGTENRLRAAAGRMVTVAASLLTLQCRAGDVSWINPDGGTWNEPANWSTGIVPGPADHAILDLPGTYTVRADGDVLLSGLSIGGTEGTQTLATGGWKLALTGASLVSTNGVIQLEGGVLQTDAPLTFDGTLNWTAGALTGSREVIITPSGHAFLSLDNYKLLQCPKLLNAGRFQWTGAGPLLLGPQTEFVNQVGGLVEALGVTYVGNDSNDGVARAFRNLGVLKKAGGADPLTFAGVALENQGSLNLDEGVLRLWGDAVLGGTLTAATGTIVEFTAGTNRVQGLYDAAGTTLVTGGTVQFAPTATVAHLGAKLDARYANVLLDTGKSHSVGELNVVGALLGGGDSLTVTGPMQWQSGGFLSGTGSVTALGPLTIDAQDGYVYQDGKTFNVGGAAAWVGGTNAWWLANGANVNLLSGSSLEIRCDGILGPQDNSDCRIRADGSIVKIAGPGQMAIEIPMSSSKTVEVQSGSLGLGGGTMTGPLICGPTATIDFRHGTNNLAGVVDFAGATIISGGVVDIGPQASVARLGASLSIPGGELRLNTGTPQTAASLSLRNGVLGGSDPLTISGGFDWSRGGRLDGSGVVTAMGPLVIDPEDGSVGIGGRTLQIASGCVWRSGGNAIFFFNGGNIENLQGSTFTIEGDSWMAPLSESPGGFRNAGLITKTGGTDTTLLAVQFDNTGTVEILRGALEMRGNATLSGPVSAAAGAALIFQQATVRVTAGFHAAGITRFFATTATFDGPTSFEALDITSATVGGAGEITVHGELSLRDGAVLSGPSPVNALGTVVLDTANGGLRIDGTSLRVATRASWIGDSGRIYLSRGGTIDIAPDATLDIQCDATLASDNDGQGRIINRGHIIKSAGAGVTELSGAGLDNTGSVEVQHGTLALHGGSAHSGSLLALPGTTLDFAGATNTINGSYKAARTVVGYQGMLQFNPTASIIGIGDSLEIAGGTVHFDTGSPRTLSAVALSNGALGGSDPLTVTGAFNWSWRGWLEGAGNVSVTGPLVIDPEDSFVIVDGRTLQIASGAVWRGGTNSIFLTRGGAIENLAGSTFTIEGDATMEPFNGAAGGFRNAGVLRKTGDTGTTLVAVPFDNTGSVQILKGTLELRGNTTLSGPITAAPGACVNFQSATVRTTGAFQAGGRTRFYGATLTLDNPAIFTEIDATYSSLGGGGDLTVTGPLTLRAGATLFGPGIVNAQGAVTLDTTDGGVIIDGTTFRILGNAAWIGGTSPGWLYLRHTGILDVGSNASFDIQCDTAVGQDGEAPGRVVNRGRIVKSGGTGVTEFDSVPLTNTGSVEIQRGTLALHGGSAHAGSLLALPGTILDFGRGTNTFDGAYKAARTIVRPDGVLQFNKAAAVAGMGDPLEIAGGTVNFDTGSAQTLGKVVLSAGSLGGSDPITVTDAFEWSWVGRLEGSGVVSTLGPLVIDPQEHSLLLSGRTLKVAAGAVWRGSTNSIYFTQGGSIENLSGSTMVIEGDSSMESLDETARGFRNAGILRKTGNIGATILTVPFENTGTVEVLKGTLEFRGVTTLSGPMLASPGADINFQWAVVKATGAFRAEGVTRFHGTTATFDTPTSFGELVVSAGAISAAGDTTITGPLTLREGASLVGPGIVNALASVVLDTSEGGIGIDGTTLRILAGGLWIGDAGRIYLQHGGILEIGPNALLDIQCDTSVVRDGDMPGAILNKGRIIKSSGDGLTEVYQIPLTNSGSIEVRHGTFALHGGSAHSGSLLGLPGTTLDFAAGTNTIDGAYKAARTVVGFGGVLQFNKAVGTIDLGDSIEIAGGAANFDTGSPQTLPKVTVTYGSLGGTDPLVVTNDFRWLEAGRIEGSGPITTLAPVEISPADHDVLLNGRTLNLAGGARWTAATNYIYFSNGGTINNQPGSVLQFEGEGVMYNLEGKPGGIENGGTILRTGTVGTTSLWVPIHNTGLIQTETGLLEVVADGYSTGDVRVGLNSGIKFRANTFRITGTYAAQGNTTIEAAEVDFDSPATAATLDLIAGRVGGSAQVTVAGAMTCRSQGALIGSASVEALGPLLIDNPDTWFYIDGKTLNVHADARWTTNSQAIAFAHGAAMNILKDSTFTIEGDNIFYQYETPVCSINNMGRIVKAKGSGTAAFQGVPLFNAGSIETRAGSLVIGGGSIHTGSLSGEPGTSTVFIGGTNEIFGSYNAGRTELGYNGVAHFNTGAGLVELGESLDISGGAALFDTGIPQTLPNTILGYGSIGGGDSLTFTGPLHWLAGGRVEGSGVATSLAPVSIDPGDRSVVLSGRTFNVAAGIEWLGSTNMIYVANGATLNNLAGSTFLIAGDSAVGTLDGTGGRIVNAGVLRKSGEAGVTLIQVPIVSTGSIEVTKGMLSFSTVGTISGPITSAPGATLDFRWGNVTIDGSYNASGPTVLTGGTVQFNGTANLVGLDTVGATLAGNGTVTLTGPSILRRSLLTGAGVVEAKGPLIIDCSEGWFGIDGKTLRIANGARWLGSDTAIYLSNGGIIDNLQGSTFSIEGDATLGQDSANAALFRNAGLIRKDAGTNTTFLNVPLLSTGPVRVQNGTLALSSGFEADALYAAPGALVLFHWGTNEVRGVYEASDTTKVTDQAVVKFQPGARVVSFGKRAEISGGMLHLNTGTPQAFNDVMATWGGLGGSDPITITGKLNLLEGAWMEGSGAIDAQGPVTIEGNAHYVVLDGRELNIHANATWSGTGEYFYIGHGGLLHNLPNSSLILTGQASISSWDGALGSVLNEGTFYVAGAGEENSETWFSVPLRNAGILGADAGQLAFYAGLELLPTSTLQVQLAGGAPLLQYAQIEAWNHVHLGGTLAITTANQFLPAPLESFRIMLWDNQDGGFTRETGLDLGNGRFLQAICDVGGLSLVTRDTAVPEPPKRTNLVDLAVAIGDPATFAFSPPGPAPLSFQWLYKGTELPGETGPDLTLPHAQTADAGSYCARVVDGSGQTNLYCAVLSVLAPPVLTNSPASITLTNHDVFVFTVAATGDGPFQYQWRLNGANIPGANSDAYWIPNPQPADGGSYDVVVANAARAVASTNAVLRVDGAILPFADNFADRGSTNSPAGVGLASNVNATREPGEPQHAFKNGANSVWMEWIAPTNGVATFSTRGSSFDTLLAIYTGSTPGTLVRLAHDDDRGGFFTSKASFDAVAGHAYQIAVDGFAGQTGDIVLTWSVDTDVSDIPRFVDQPLDVTASQGGTTTFTAFAASSTNVFYQWYQNCCLAIPGATNTSLTLSNIGPLDVGFYRVEATTASGQTVRSTDAILEIGPSSDAHSFDKLEELLATQDGANPGGRLAGHVQSGGGAGGVAFPSVSVGALGSQIINNYNSTTSKGEPIHSDVIGGASRWFQITATTDGILQIDTIGSDIDTVLAVYTGNSALTLRKAASDDNSAPDGIRSLVTITNTGQTRYLIAVDGVRGVQGNINLNWRMGTPPQPGGGGGTIQTPVLAEGASLTLAAGSVTAQPAPAYKWLLNGVAIPGATNSSLVLTNIKLGQQGLYSVVISNFAGSVTNKIADVTIAAPLRVELDRTTGGGLTVRLVGTSPQPVTLQVSTNLTHWSPIFTNSDPKIPMTYVDPQASNRRLGFYRLMPWP